jgi:hypothetical protein
MQSYQRKPDLTRASRVGDVINNWRRELDLDEVAMFEGPHLPEILRVPFTYCWSTALVPRPSDWPAYIGQIPLNGLPAREIETNRAP